MSKVAPAFISSFPSASVPVPDGTEPVIPVPATCKMTYPAQGWVNVQVVTDVVVPVLPTVAGKLPVTVAAGAAFVVPE